MTFPLTDTHCHLDLEQFDADRAEVIARAVSAGVTRILVPALDLASSRRVVQLASTQSMIFAGVGVHPTQAGDWDADSRAGLRELATIGNAQGESGRVVAFGEIGLDYYWDSAPHGTQQAVLREQLALAGDLSLPVVLHMREAKDQPSGPCAEGLLEILETWTGELRGAGSPLASRPGVLHSFSGDLPTARRAIELGFWIGVTGPVTFKNAEARRELVRALPLERLLIETDAPYLAPVPRRGSRNEPAFVAHIADKIAEIHNTTPERVAAVTSENAHRLFDW